MMADLDGTRWEHGSGFHWRTPTTLLEPEDHWGGHSLYGTGRHALAAILRHGVAHRGWRRLWVPAYYCHETLASVASHIGSSFEMPIFDDGPLAPRCALPVSEMAAGDVILVVNYFGLFSSRRLAGGTPDGVEVVEDHTHDPWSPWARESTAQYAFASLRKTLPIPDGGVAWSPRREPLPSPTERAAEHEAAAALRLESMLLKALYLAGWPVAKSTYLDLERRSERLIGSGPIAFPSSITGELMPLMPTRPWREARLGNFRRLVDRIAEVPEVAVLRPETSSEVPFSAVLHCRNRADRDRLMSFLIGERVYPAVLWDLGSSTARAFPEQDVVSGCLLSIHCDFRYVPNDMDRVADAVARGTRAMS